MENVRTNTAEGTNRATDPTDLENAASYLDQLDRTLDRAMARAQRIVADQEHELCDGVEGNARSSTRVVLPRLAAALRKAVDQVDMVRMYVNGAQAAVPEASKAPDPAGAHGKPSYEPESLARWLEIESQNLCAQARDLSEGLDTLEEALTEVECSGAGHKVSAAVATLKEQVAGLREVRTWVGTSANSLWEKVPEVARLEAFGGATRPRTKKVADPDHGERERDQEPGRESGTHALTERVVARSAPEAHAD